jgi:hypothetical protein
MEDGKWKMEKRPAFGAVFHIPFSIYHPGRRFSAAWDSVVNSVACLAEDLKS